MKEERLITFSMFARICQSGRNKRALMRFECQQLCKAYFGSDKAVSVLEDVSFTVEEGEFVCIVGPSGCGPELSGRKFPSPQPY